MVSIYYLIALDNNPPVSWADPFYLGDSLLILAAPCRRSALTRRTRLERWKFVLDAAMVLLAGGVAIWYFCVRPTWGAEGGSVVHHGARARIPAGEPAAAARRHHGAAPRAARRQPARILTCSSAA